MIDLLSPHQSDIITGWDSLGLYPGTYTVVDPWHVFRGNLYSHLLQCVDNEKRSGVVRLYWYNHPDKVIDMFAWNVGSGEGMYTVRDDGGEEVGVVHVFSNILCIYRGFSIGKFPGEGVEFEIAQDITVRRGDKGLVAGEGLLMVERSK